MRALPVLALALLLGCRPEPAAVTAADLLADPETALAAARAACVEAGGDWTRGRDGAERCVRTPEDANRPCRTGADCEGVCLARSRTCAPAIPLLGCHEVIASTGLRSELCLE